jgi:fibronectin-binding autotransporter adhesin
MKILTRKLAVLALVTGALLTTQYASATTNVWTGAAAATDRNWNTTGNWGPAKPTVADDVVFGNVDTTTATSGPAGVSNSVVDASFTSAIKSIRFTNTSGYHNLRLVNNLNVTNTGAVDTFFVGTALPSSTQTVYATISGPAALTVTNTTGYFRVCQGTNSTGGGTSARATLDLSGLDTFSARVAGFYVAYSADSTDSAKWNRPAAYLYLARTNYITCTSHLFSESYNNNGTTSLEQLGQVNYFGADTLEVGGRKGRATMSFNPIWSSPVANFRNAAGTGRSTWYIGTDNGSTGTGNTISTLDLSGGTVDALVGTMYVGQSEAYASSSDSGDGTGTLTFGNGTVDVTTVEMGYQVGSGGFGGESTGKGTINVRTNGLLKVSGNLRLARQLPPYAAGVLDQCGALLTINNGTVTVAGNILDGGGTNSIVVTNYGTLNLQPAGDATAGSIATKSLFLGAGWVTNWSTLTTANITLLDPATEFTVYPGQTLVPVAAGTAGTLQVTGDLRLTNATVKYDLGDPSTYDQIAVTGSLALKGTNTVNINIIGAPSGSYPLMTYGTTLDGTADNLALIGPIGTSRYTPTFDTATLGQVNLVLNGSATNLTWAGGLNGDAWDLTNTLNFNSNTERFYTLDNVTFDNTSANTNVNLVGVLQPGSVTVSSDYVLSGSGKVTGGGQLTVNGGTLTLLTTNDLVGNTIINTGTLQVGNGTTADGGLTVSPIQNNSALIFNPAATQSVAGVISGSGTLTKQGPGITALKGANTFSSDLTISEGMVIAGSTAALGDANGRTTVTNGGTLDINGINFSTEPVYVSGAGVGGKGAIVNNGAGQADALAAITIIGDTTLGGSGGRMDINNVSGTPGCLLSDPAGFKLTKMGTNAVSLFNNYGLSSNVSQLFNTQLGEIEVKEGVLRVQCGTILGDATKTVAVRSNATFQLDNLWSNNIIQKVVVLDDGAGMYSTRSGAYNWFGGPITLNGINTFDAISGAYLILTNEISGTGSLVKNIGYHPGSPETSTGTGVLILSASNSFTGDFKIQTGTAILTNSAASVTKAASIWMAGGTLTILRPDATLALATGQTFKGNGTLNGKLSSPVGTTVAPGTTTTAATLTLKGDTTLRGTNIMDITKSGITLTADKLAVTGVLDLGGTLTVNLAGTTALAAGDKFTLFTATSFTGGFTTLNLPGGPSVIWTNKTAIDGTIEVLQAEPTARPSLISSVSSGSMSLSWDTAYTSYVLEGETNSRSIGLTTNSADWHTVPGVSGNQISIPIDPANGSVFFRLRK